MRSDFAGAGKSAMQQIRVPELSIDLIRARSSERSRRDHMRTLVLYAALCLSVIGVGTGLAARVYSGIHVWFYGGKAAVTIDSLVSQQEPTKEDLRAVLNRAAFPVVLPVGMPAGTRIDGLKYAPLGHPNSIIVEYRNVRTNLRLTLSLFDSSAITKGTTGLPSRKASMVNPASGLDVWTIDKETVVASKQVPAKEIDRIKAAMMTTSPQQSLKAAGPMLRRIIVEGGSDTVADAVEQYAPPTYRSVLLDRKYIGWIPWLAKRKKLGPDSRMVVVTDIPMIHGQPDYMNATVNWPNKIMPRLGVQAVWAFLQATHTGPKCRCELLYYRPNAATFAIWKISVADPRRVARYVVDAKTLVVRAER